jgi:small subunit ribosomal protein S5
MVIGDGKGRVAFGAGKSGEVVTAIQKAINNAKKELVKVDICEGSTVSHEIKTKYKSAVIMLHPASEGTGLIAGGAIRKVLNVAGFKNVLAKRYGSTNLINNARATIKALTSMKK